MSPTCLTSCPCWLRVQHTWQLDHAGVISQVKIPWLIRKLTLENCNLTNVVLKALASKWAPVWQWAIFLLEMPLFPSSGKKREKKKKKKEGLNNKRRHRLVSQYLHANIYMQRHGSASSYSYLLKLVSPLRTFSLKQNVRKVHHRCLNCWRLICRYK